MFLFCYDVLPCSPSRNKIYDKRRTLAVNEDGDSHSAMIMILRGRCWLLPPVDTYILRLRLYILLHSTHILHTTAHSHTGEGSSWSVWNSQRLQTADGGVYSASEGLACQPPRRTAHEESQYSSCSNPHLSGTTHSRRSPSDTEKQRNWS